MAGLPKLDPAKVRRIRELVASRRMTRTEVCDEYKLTYNHVCRIMRGEFWVVDRRVRQK